MVRFSKSSQNSGFAIISVCFLIGGAFFAWGAYINSQKLQLAVSKEELPKLSQAPQSQQIQIQVDAEGDGRFTRAPKPERDWMGRPDMDAVRNSGINLPAIATRGIPESYQSMGVLKMDDGEILPLYGRRTASRSDRFQYYTRTDSYNPVQLPLRHKNRDCQDIVGCEELFDGDTMVVAATGKRGSVTIYRFSGPTYIPIVT
jgi:hypothetical protein